MKRDHILLYLPQFSSVFRLPGRKTHGAAAVYQRTHKCRQYHPCRDVKDRMLLQKHGRGDNADREKCRAQADRPVRLKIVTVAYRRMDGDGIVYMDARKQVRCRVGGVEPFHKCDKNVIARKAVGAQVMPVRVERGDNQKDRHSGKKYNAEPEIFIPVFTVKVGEAPGDVAEPHQIRNDEIFAERNIVVESDMDHVKMCGHRPLKMAEPGQVHRKIKEQQTVFILFEEGQKRRVYSCFQNIILFAFYLSAIIAQRF